MNATVRVSIGCTDEELKKTLSQLEPTDIVEIYGMDVSVYVPVKELLKGGVVDTFHKYHSPTIPPTDG